MTTSSLFLWIERRIGMDILYSDKDIIACIKPVGMDAEHEVPEAL